MTKKAKRPALLQRKVGDIVAVEIEPGLFCYVRKYAFGHGVLPFFSKGGVLPRDDLPSIRPEVFLDIWVYDDDSTGMQLVGSFPFDSEEESWGEPAYEPPDLIESCFRIHGVFHGVASIIKPVNEEQTVGMRLLRRYQPADFGDVLKERRAAWRTIDLSSGN